MLLMACISLSSAAESSPGEIKGTLRNNTLNGRPVPDMEVILYQFKG